MPLWFTVRSSVSISIGEPILLVQLKESYLYHLGISEKTNEGEVRGRSVRGRGGVGR